MGRPAKPKHLHILHGTFRADRDRGGMGPRFPPGMPRCPSWLPALAKAEWKRVKPLLEAAGAVTHADMAVLAVYCSAVAELEEATAILAREGRFYLSDSGQRKPHPAIGMQRSAWSAVRQVAALFGLDPASRGRITADPPPAEDDSFEAKALRKDISRFFDRKDDDFDTFVQSRDTPPTPA